MRHAAKRKRRGPGAEDGVDRTKRVRSDEGPVGDDSLHGEAGFALVAVLFLMLLMAGFAAAMQLTGRTEFRIANNHAGATQSYYAAEAGAEKFLAGVQSRMGYGALTPEAVAEAATDPPTVTGYTFTDFSATLATDVVARQIPMGPFAGLTSLDRDLTITSAVEGPDGTRATITLDARAQAIPIFQFAVFYNEDLEIDPLPRMDITGRVHTNGDLYIKAKDGLYLWDVVTAAGDFYREHKHNDFNYSSTANFIQLNDDSWVEIFQDSNDFGSDEAFDNHSKATWDHNLQTEASGVQPLRLPIPEGIEPYELVQPCTGGEAASLAAIKYACIAGLVIEVKGTELEITAGGSPYSMDVDAVDFDINKFYDDREQWTDSGNGSSTATNETSDRDVIEINLSEFDSSDYQNGIIYVTADEVGAGGPDADADEKQYVVRIRGGAVLDDALTIASSLPMYVQGDYNSDDTQWVPAALVGDALTILSNNWSDSNAYEDSSPDASTNTTVQAAILTGHTPSVLGGTPAGGMLENFPRFLEHFGSSRTVEINGSLVSLWFAQYTDSEWACCAPSEYYYPPRRDWTFDERFLDPENLPNGTPTVGQVVRMGFARSY